MWNQLKTALFLGLLMGLFLFIGSFFGRNGLTIALIFGFGFNFLQYFFSDKIVLAMYRAKEIKKSEAPNLYKIIEDICKRANMPKPKKVCLIPTDTPNAFCTGRGPNYYVVAVTQGILNILTNEELKGVLAHEIGHSKNRDVLIATIAASIAGVIVYLANMARFSLMFGRSDDNRNSNVVGLLLLSILAPIAAVIIQLAISRSREFLADSTGAKIIKNPLALASALQKLENANRMRPLRFGSRAAASLFIVNPFSGQALINLFSTHPPLNVRIKRLKEMEI